MGARVGAVVCRRLVLLILLLALPVGAQAATYYVDGACETSGTGATLTCGATGPFKTISEGITDMAAGDTLNIRGAHDAFDGVYNEYVGIWGTDSGTYPGKALACTSGARCVVQGCPASACGSDERPEIRGMVQRSDWTDAGSGIWWRAMETAPADYIGDVGDPRDAYDPAIIMQGSSFTLLQYEGDNSSTPSEGHWSYDTSTHRVYVNPTGAGDPNAGGTAALWVPNLRVLLGVHGYECPDSSCPNSNYVTFRRLRLRGTRWHAVLLWPGDWDKTYGFVLDDIMFSHIPHFALNPYNVHASEFRNLDFQYIGRGMSWIGPGAGAGFAIRHGVGDDAIFDTITIKHLGSAGSGCGGYECHWCDAPFNTKAGNGCGTNGNGLQVKQVTGAVVTNITCEDIRDECIAIDFSAGVTVDGFSSIRTQYAVSASEFTAGGPPMKNNIIRNGVIDDCGFGFNGTGCIILSQSSVTQPLSGNDFGYRVYNNVIGHSAECGICAGGPLDRVSIWNNTIYGARSQLAGRDGAAAAVSDGIRITGAITNLDVRNNIVTNLDSEGMEIQSGTTSQSPVLDYNLFYGNTSGLVRWGATDKNSGGTLYTALATYQGATGNETHGLSAQPTFVDAAGLDFHQTSGSPGIDTGVDLSGVTGGFSTDLDGKSRVAPWELGAYEYGLRPILRSVTSQ